MVCWFSSRSRTLKESSLLSRSSQSASRSSWRATGRTRWPSRAERVPWCWATQGSAEFSLPFYPAPPFPKTTPDTSEPQVLGLQVDAHESEVARHLLRHEAGSQALAVQVQQSSLLGSRFRRSQKRLATSKTTSR